MHRTVVTNREPRKTIVYAQSAMGAIGPPGPFPIPMGIRGTLVVGIGAIPYPVPSPVTIVQIQVAVGTSPTGASIVFDVKRNGVSLGFVSPPTVLAGQTLSVPVVPNNTVLLAGDKLTVDVVSVGSVIAGANATLVIEVV